MRFRWLAPLLVAVAWVLAPAAGAQSLWTLDTNFGAPTLRQSDPDGNLLASLPLPAGTLPEGLAVGADGKLYWAEAAWANARIQRLPPTLSAIATLVAGGSVFRGIAIDEVDQLLYWTSSNLIAGAQIHRAALDGSGAITLIALGPGANPRGIAVDHAGGKLYWADFDQSAIFRAELDGSSPAVWVSLPSNSGPYGVAFDPIGQRVYWTEFAGKMRRAPTGGGGMTTVLGGLANPTYLALDPAGGRMYWSEGGAGVQRIQKSDLDGVGVTTLPLPVATYGGLAWQPNANVSVPAPGPALPRVLALDPPAPNPGTGPVRVGYALPRDLPVRLSVVDLQGREVAVLANGVMPAGRHQAVWNAAGPGRPAAAGMYFVRLVAEGRTWVRRVVLTR